MREVLNRLALEHLIELEVELKWRRNGGEFGRDVTDGSDVEDEVG